MQPSDLLVLFCAPPGDVRKLDRCYRGDGHVYATDGKVVLKIEDDPSVEASPDDPSGWAAKIEALFAKRSPDHATFTALEIALPTIECGKCTGSGLVPAMVACEDCHGEGGVHFTVGRHDYAVECAECDGAGKVAGPERLECLKCAGGGKVYAGDRTRIGARAFSTRYALLLRRLPDAEFAVDAGEASDPLAFRGECDGRRYVGLAMPLFS